MKGPIVDGGHTGARADGRSSQLLLRALRDNHDSLFFHVIISFEGCVSGYF